MNWALALIRIDFNTSHFVLFQFNFVGRILGPRGLTAKQLEQETGCKVMVRGKGSMRDKKKVSPELWSVLYQRSEREPAVETIITRKGVSNHAQPQSNVGKKWAMIKDHPPSEGWWGSACFIRPGHWTNSCSHCLAREILKPVPILLNVRKCSYDPASCFISECPVFGQGILVPLRTIIFRLCLSQVRVIQRRQGPHDFACKYPHHSASLYAPICPSSLSVNLKLLLSFRDIIEPPLHYVILCIIALTVESVRRLRRSWSRIKGWLRCQDMSPAKH